MTSATTTAAPFVGRMAGEMRFVGIYSIVAGALMCLSIVGALIGIPMIIAGLRLRESAEHFGEFEREGDPLTLDRALERQKTYFTIMKWMIIISLVAMVLSILVSIGSMATMFGSMM